MFNEQDDLATVLIAENPVSLLMQILECADFVGVNKNDDVFEHFLMHKEIGGPEIKRTKHTCGRFSVPNVEYIMELRCA